jgi:beta-glucosidase-like glycosyl hydrolase
MHSMSSRAGALILYVSGTLSTVAAAQIDRQPDIRVRADEKAAALVAQLTFDEKVDQLLNVAPAIPRLGIPAYNWWTESLHGALGPVPTTNFPEPIGLAASLAGSGDSVPYDRYLVLRYGQVVPDFNRGYHEFRDFGALEALVCAHLAVYELMAPIIESEIKQAMLH